MSVRITLWKKGPAEGYEIDIRITWPEGGRFRERLKSPVTGKDASLRWAKRRESALLKRGRDDALGNTLFACADSAAGGVARALLVGCFGIMSADKNSVDGDAIHAERSPE
jgi:hypothetical protein